MEDIKITTKHEKVTLVIFLLIGVAAFALSFKNISQNLKEPFLRTDKFHVKTAEEIEDERIAGLKEADTDKDELNDYDELYVFKTSPFLEDTDSDGSLDGAEVMAGMDPNCPKGQVCRGVAAATTGSSTTGETTMPSVGTSGQVVPSTQGTTTGTGAATSDAEQAIVDAFGDLATLTPEGMMTRTDAMTESELETFLIRIGLPETSVKAKTTAELRQIIKDSLIEAVAVSQESQSVNQ